MKRADASEIADLKLSMGIAVLATVLLLILGATRVSAQNAPPAIATTSATTSAATSAAMTGEVPVMRGKARVTWPKATRAIPRGATIASSDYELVDTVIVWAWKEAPTDTITAITGFTTRRMIAEGEFMHGASVTPGNVIAAGSAVKVLWQDGNVRLTLKGTATNNAILGAPVGVRIDKDRRLDGVAVGPNTVRLR
jgi:flagella basal body P-ring formation protein FlgA